MPKLTDIKNFNVEKTLGDVLPDIFILFYNDLKKNLIKLHRKYTTDNLHDTRVTARRMESLFIGYEDVLKSGLKKKSVDEYEKIIKLIKRIIKLFGQPREIQVLFDIVRNYNKNNRDEKLASKLFYSDLRINRVKFIDDLYSSKEFKKSLKSVEKIPEYISDFICGNLPSTIFMIPFREHYSHLINKMKFRLFSDLAGIDSIDSELLHRIRIETKPLRYLLDMCVGLLGEEFGNFRSLIKVLVEKIGEYHDVDVVQQKAFSHFINFKKTQSESANQFVDYLNYLEQEKIKHKVEIIRIAKQLISEKATQ
ncbi:MAG: CHAD domain-containing protein [Ignavibacteria bacterium]|nr:CHAD domain-containing protein [Ignavibacteria bacterium]